MRRAIRRVLKQTNCLFFAIKLYYRRRRKGKKGFVIARLSKYYPGPHFMYARMCKNGVSQIVGYVPKHPRTRLIPPPIFEGKVKWGDDPAIL